MIEHGKRILLVLFARMRCVGLNNLITITEELALLAIKKNPADHCDIYHIDLLGLFLCNFIFNPDID